jgi:hypothetical protein
VPAKRPGSNRTAASRVSLVGPNEPKPIVCCGVDEGIPSRKGAERQRTTGVKASTSGEKKKRPPPKAQAASLVSAVTPLLPSATPLAPPSPHDNRFSVPSRLFVRAAADALEAVARRAQAALLRRGRRRGGPVSRALSFFFSRVLSSVLGPELGDRVCSVHEIVSSNFTSSQIVVRFID